MPPLTRDRILRAAVDLADADGLDAVTLRRLAAGLGVHVTSLYNHVPTRDAVTDGMLEVLLLDAELPARAVAWESWVRAFWAAMDEVAARHPGAVEVFNRRPVQGAPAAATFEVALEAFTAAGLPPAEAYHALKTVTMLGVAFGVERAALARGQAEQTDTSRLPLADFPVLAAVIAADEEPERTWDFALETLVAGLRSAIRQSRQNAKT